MKNDTFRPESPPNAQKVRPAATRNPLIVAAQPPLAPSVRGLSQNLFCDWGSVLKSDNTPSVFCFAKATSLFEGGKAHRRGNDRIVWRRSRSRGAFCAPQKNGQYPWWVLPGMFSYYSSSIVMGSALGALTNFISSSPVMVSLVSRYSATSFKSSRLSVSSCRVSS